MTQQEFTRYLTKDCGLLPHSHVLMAVSGGADSVAMLRLFVSVRESFPLSLSCAHVEHGIRGKDSLEDLTFVRTLCEQENVPLYWKHVDAPAYAKANGCGLEDAARTLRYAFLERTADEIGADAIALAHHAGDQAETVLMRAARGSDVRGLCAMRHRREKLIRPLLSVQMQALRAYLESIGQSWREDVTNCDTVYTRNRLRHDVLPQLEAAVPGAGSALCRLARAAQRDADYFAKQLDALGVEMHALLDGAAVEKRLLEPLHPALCSRLLVRAIEFAGIPTQSAQTIEAVMDALCENDAVVNLTGGAHAVIGRRYLCLVRPDETEADVPLRIPGVTDTPFGRISVRKALPGETGDGKREQAIASRLLDGVHVTGRREGDAMVPFGMHTKVKLKKLMIDAGIERAMRNSVPVLRRGDMVLFAAGLRPDECVRSTGEEERMIVRLEGPMPWAEETKQSGGNRHD